LSQRLELVIPARLYRMLEDCERKSGIKKEDLLMRALVKVVEEFRE